MPEIFDPRKCALGEGPLWHPLRQQLFWFDILGKQLLSRKDGAQMAWQFDEHVSAAGWIDRDTLLIASETCLQKFDLTTGTGQPLIALEADNDVTRSNDGRADPWGGFWIGTMGKSTERRAGKIYRYFEGALTVLFDEITISNAICLRSRQEHRLLYGYSTATDHGATSGSAGLAQGGGKCLCRPSRRRSFPGWGGCGSGGLSLECTMGSRAGRPLFTHRCFPVPAAFAGRRKPPAPPLVEKICKPCL